MEQTVRLFTDRKKRLFTAESCTAGLLAASLADVPGASAMLLGGIVCYDNSIKEKLLGVSKAALTGDGAVSFACCEEMLRGAKRLSGADISCAVTGIAGPGGGSLKKPVGTVFIGALGAEGGIMLHMLLPGNRGEVRTASALLMARLACALELGEVLDSPFIKESKKISP